MALHPSTGFRWLKRWLALKMLGKRGKKPNDFLVGVAGFEPATPASRTQQTPPDTEQLQRLNETPDDGTEKKNLKDLGPSFKSRSNSADSSEELGPPAPDAPEDAPAGFTPLPSNLLHEPSDEATDSPSEFRLVPLAAITIPDGRLRGVIEEFLPAM